MILGIDPALRFKPATRVENACASGSAALFAAIDAIRSGRIRTALVIGAEKMTGLNTAGVTRALCGASYQREERGMSFPAIFARFAQAYAASYGDPTGAMAHIAVGATGVSMHVLNARQLVGEADSMQLPEVNLAAALNMGGGAVASYVTIMERAK